VIATLPDTSRVPPPPVHMLTKRETSYGDPIAVDPRPWPRTKEQTGETLALLTEALRAHLSAARDLTGRELPGPIPGVLP